MKRYYITLVAILILAVDMAGQQPEWRMTVFNFFDNTEFGRSVYKIPQTMAGVYIAPELGLRIDSINRISVGVNLLHEYGSADVIGGISPVAYYSREKDNMRFLMGAFPRAGVLDRYPRLFFQDSISYYRPNINGLFWEFHKSDSYINVWLDWTGRQSKTVHESFFIGSSGRYRRGIFYVNYFADMYHYAERMDPVIEEPLHDNMMMMTSVGIDVSGNWNFDRLELGAGLVAATERSRADNTGWLSRKGLIVEGRAEYRILGLSNTFYTGDGFMVFYRELGNRLYYGDPAFRAKTYNRTDIYLRFIRSKLVNVELTYSLHFMENRVYHEQMLKAIVNLEGRKLKGR